MNQSPLSKKLLIKPGHRVLLLNAPEGYDDVLTPLPPDADVHHSPDGEYDCALLFARDKTQLDTHVPVLLDSVVVDGLIWIAFPKGGSGLQTNLSRDKGWDSLEDAGYRLVSVVSADDVWSVARVRPR